MGDVDPFLEQIDWGHRTAQEILTSEPTDTMARFAAVVEFADGLGAATIDNVIAIRDAAVANILEMPQVAELTPADPSGIPGMTVGNPDYPMIDPILIPDVDFPYPVPDPADVVITTDPPPEFSGTQPPITIPPAPTEVFPTFSEDPPQISTPTIPSPPIYTLPPVPKIDDISVPSPPEFNFPDWDGEPPTQDLTPPSPMFAWNETEYDSTLKQLLATKLADGVVNGGSGIDPLWEAAFLARMRVNLAEKHEEMYIEAENRWAGRGFTMPPGALAGQILEIQKQAMRDEENLLNDIIIKQEELAFEYGKFVIETSIQYEKNLMDYINAFQNRAFEAAKYTVEVSIKIYEAKVEAYKAQLTAYQVLAQVYESRIRAEIGKAEMYKAVIEGVKAEVDIKQALIEAYKAQIAGISTLVELYKAEMQGAQVQADVDRTRIESFQALVQAYAAQIGAIKARYEAYQAQIGGEAAKVSIWEAEAKAYEAIVQGYAAKANVDVARAEAELKVNMSEVEVYKSLVSKYEAEIQYAMKAVDATVSVEKLDVEAYDVATKQYLGELDAQVRRLMANVEQYKAGAMYAQAHATITAAQARAQATMTAASTEAAARTAAATIAAAYAGISHTSSFGYREVRSDNTSQVDQSTNISQGQAASGHYTHVNIEG